METVETFIKRINEYMLIEDTREAISYIEDELDELIEKIYGEGKIQPDMMMKGNGFIYRKTEKGFVIKSDDGSTLFLPKRCYKGKGTDLKTRVQYDKVQEKDGKKYCFDAMECVPYDELVYQMFSYIDDGKMAWAATSAWAIYKDASEELNLMMKTAIHMLRDYVRGLQVFQKTAA